MWTKLDYFCKHSFLIAWSPWLPLASFTLFKESDNNTESPWSHMAPIIWMFQGMKMKRRKEEEVKWQKEKSEQQKEREQEGVS